MRLQLLAYVAKRASGQTSSGLPPEEQCTDGAGWWCQVSKRMRKKEARRPGAGIGWHEVFLNTEEARNAPSASVSVENGHSVMVLHAVASKEECEALRHEASKAAATENSVGNMRWGAPEAPGRLRMPVLQAFGLVGQDLCDQLLLRTLARVADDLPVLLPTLLQEGTLDAMSVMHNGKLTFSAGEPAVNVYGVGGEFRPHCDEERLTILVPLSEAATFVGGAAALTRQSKLRCVLYLCVPYNATRWHCLLGSR
jgi:hypothetical protein